jgi:hypothetical protein
MLSSILFLYIMSTLKARLVEIATIIGTIAACIVIGYSLGKDTNDGLLNFLREKNQTSEKTESLLRAELSSAQLELQKVKSLQTPPLQPSQSESSSSSPSEKKYSERFEILAGTTATAFGGDISISLVGINFGGNPLRHMATASIGAPGQKSKVLDQVDVGTSVIYNGFEIRVISTGTFGAIFLVARLKNSDAVNAKNSA